MLRVLHVLHVSQPLVCGYSIRSEKILESQRRAGLKICVVTSAQQPSPNEEMDVGDTHYWRTPSTGTSRSPVRELRLMNGLFRRLREASEQFRPHLIHAHSPILVGIPAWRVARARRIPFVYEVRDLWENASVDRGKFAYGSLPYRIAHQLETTLVRRADAVVTICDALQRNLEARRGAEVTIVPNGVDTLRFSPMDPLPEWRKQWNDGRQPTLAYIGSFQPYEGLDVLLRAMKTLRERLNARLLIAGDGPERRRLTDLSRQLGVDAAVLFTGHLPHERVCEIYSAADLLVYPRVETMTTRLTTPLKPLEAMSMARPVLASDLPPMREIVQDGVTGLLFRPGDPDHLATTAIDLLTKPDYRRALAGNARDYVSQTRTWATCTAPYFGLYAKLNASDAT